MNLFVRGMMPTTEGDTILTNRFPWLLDSAIDNTNERGKLQPSLFQENPQLNSLPCIAQVWSFW